MSTTMNHIPNTTLAIILSLLTSESPIEISYSNLHEITMQTILDKNDAINNFEKSLEQLEQYLNEISILSSEKQIEDRKYETNLKEIYSDIDSTTILKETEEHCYFPHIIKIEKNETTFEFKLSITKDNKKHLKNYLKNYLKKFKEGDINYSYRVQSGNWIISNFDTNYKTLESKLKKSIKLSKNFKRYVIDDISLIPVIFDYWLNDKLEVFNCNVELNDNLDSISIYWGRMDKFGNIVEEGYYDDFYKQFNTKLIADVSHLMDKHQKKAKIEKEKYLTKKHKALANCIISQGENRNWNGNIFINIKEINAIFKTTNHNAFLSELSRFKKSFCNYYNITDKNIKIITADRSYMERNKCINYIVNLSELGKYCKP